VKTAGIESGKQSKQRKLIISLKLEFYVKTKDEFFKDIINLKPNQDDFIDVAYLAYIINVMVELAEEGLKI
jgi:hypothetical protein